MLKKIITAALALEPVESFPKLVKKDKEEKDKEKNKENKELTNEKPN